GPDKTAEMRPVQVVLNEGLIAVVTGVREGEQVVTDGADKLQPHGKVEEGGSRGGRGNSMTHPSPGLRPPSPRSRGARGNNAGSSPSPRSRGEGARRADEGRAPAQAPR